jgi:hypothetical protein
MNGLKGQLHAKREAATNELQRTIAERLESQDGVEFGLGDTLDMKTNVALVVIVFLATQSGWFLTLPMPRHWHNAQIVSVACLVVAGLAAMYVLIPRKYKLKLEPDKFLEWLEGVKRFYGDDEIAILEFMRQKEIEKTVTRIARNSAINGRKSSVMEVSFWFTIASLGTNVVTLLALAIGWRF